MGRGFANQMFLTTALMYALKIKPKNIVWSGKQIFYYGGIHEESPGGVGRGIVKASFLSNEFSEVHFNCWNRILIFL